MYIYNLVTEKNLNLISNKVKFENKLDSRNIKVNFSCPWENVNKLC